MQDDDPDLLLFEGLVQAVYHYRAQLENDPTALGKLKIFVFTWYPKIIWISCIISFLITQIYSQTSELYFTKYFFTCQESVDGDQKISLSDWTIFSQKIKLITRIGEDCELFLVELIKLIIK